MMMKVATLAVLFSLLQGTSVVLGMGDSTSKYYLNLNGITPQEQYEQASVQWAREDNFAAPSGMSVSLDRMTGPIGQLRVPHWHSGTELHYLLEGEVRVQTIFNGYEEVFIQRPGDVFLTPEGYSHFFEKISDEEVVMVSLFASGDVETFDLTESFGILRELNPEVLAQTFGVDVSIINSLHAHGKNDQNPTKDGFTMPLPGYQYKKKELTSHRCFKLPDLDGDMHARYGTYYPQSKVIWATQPYYGHLEDLGFAQITLQPGALREPQWQGVGNEFGFVIQGTVEFGVAGRLKDAAEKHTVGQYELVWSPHNFVSYFKNVGDEPAIILLMYDTEAPELTSMREVYTKTPLEVLSTMHKVEPEVFEQFSKLGRTPNPGPRLTANNEGCPDSNRAKLRNIG